jgi:hypothetical protein
VHREIVRLDELQAQNGKLTRGQLRTLLQTGDVERELGQTFIDLSERMASVEVLSLTLRRIADRMAALAELLKEKQLDAAVRARFVAVDEQLARLMAILAAAEKSDPKSQTQQAQPEQPQPQPTGPPGDVVTLIAQLELLRDLQADCIRRMEELEQSRGDAVELTEAEAAELESIHADQSKLTDLARNLLIKLRQQSGESNQPPAGGGF